jgi:GNAT superfamily N-acetyltransferase
MITPHTLRIIPFTDDLAPAFHAINAEWIEAMYVMEPADRDVLENPRARIIDRGGDILFVAAEGLGIVGACALRRTAGASIELTKMGVTAAARGSGAGAFLLAAVIARGLAIGADPLYLLSSRKSEAAIHLYERHGFAHDTDIMQQFGTAYERCNVAMRYIGHG